MLENATFTSPANAAHLAGTTASTSAGAAQGPGGSGSKDSDPGGLAPLLVALLQPMCAAVLAGDAACQQCLHGCLALLMNLTHGTTEGGVSAISGVGGAQAIVALLDRLLPAWWSSEPSALRAEVSPVTTSRFRLSGLLL